MIINVDVNELINYYPLDTLKCFERPKLILTEYMLHFTELSGRHSVLERPLSEVNGRLFFS